MQGFRTLKNISAILIYYYNNSIIAAVMYAYTMVRSKFKLILLILIA